MLAKKRCIHCICTVCELHILSVHHICMVENILVNETTTQNSMHTHTEHKITEHYNESAI